MNQTIGKRIQQLRKQKGMSQQDLSDVLNITRQTISKWESDQTLPDLNALIKMTELFNVSIAYIVGVEEDNKSISEMYDLMQTVLNNQQKSNRTRNIIQILTILLCVFSLGLNISMKHQLDNQTKNSQNELVESAYKKGNEAIENIYNWTRDSSLIIHNNPYLMYPSSIDVEYFDLDNMMVNISANFYLSEYTENTTVTLEMDAQGEDGYLTFDLSHDSENLYVLNEKIPLYNYYDIILKIDDGKGTIRTTALTETVPRNYFFHALFSQMNLFIPLNEDGKLQLDTLEFDPTYYNTASDNHYMGYLDGYMTIRLYESAQGGLIDYFKVTFDQRATLVLKEKLPLDTPIYIDVDYFIPDPNGEDSFIGNFGKEIDNNGQTDLLSFTIENTNERYRIFQMPETYNEELDAYWFKD